MEEITMTTITYVLYQIINEDGHTRSKQVFIADKTHPTLSNCIEEPQRN